MMILFLVLLLLYFQSNGLTSAEQFDEVKKLAQTILCPTDFFRCDVFQCLPKAFVCNGEYNCQDRTDEMNCSIAILNPNLCHVNHSINCEQDILHSTRFIDHPIRFEYNRPVQICIERSSVCDGVIDCRNGIDEQCTERNPLITCFKHEYHCQVTNRCIPQSWLCNGINDCLDPFASDELHCPTTRTCSSDEFLCQTNQQCVPSNAVCDGIKDCADGSDENTTLCRYPHFCAPDQFTCKSTKLCIPRSNLCDTITHCHDRSDEMSCSCPIEDYVSEKLFYRCGVTDKCLPKNVECYIKQECNALVMFHDDEEIDDPECASTYSLIERPCLINNTCAEKNQYCRGYSHKRCVCQPGYRMNETTGICEDINECRERLVCDHYCINTLGSYICACRESFQLKSDKHTCQLRTDLSPTASLFGIFDQGIHRLNMTKDHELQKIQEWTNIHRQNQTLFFPSNNAYLIDYDPVDRYLYFAECTVPIRPVIMSCPKTRGIYRIRLNGTMRKKELIIDGRDYTSIQSFAIDWFHRNIYFVNTRLQTIDVCRLNGSFCHILLHQTLSDYLPQRLVLYPEKGLLFYTSVVKARAQHVVRLGMDGTNLKLLFTVKTLTDAENANYLRPLLTFDPINHHLYFYNGFDKIFTLNMHGDVLHIQHQAAHRFHAFRIYADKMYKALFDSNESDRSEFRINPKHALGTTLLGPGFIFDLNRVVQTFHNKSSRVGQGTWTLNALHNLYYLRYPIHMNDFILIHPSEQKIPEGQCDQCEQLCFPNAINQSGITCGCGQYYNLADNGRSCQANCAPHFFNCPSSKKCIPFYQRCDGYQDCPFNEDETDCQSFTCTNKNNTQQASFRCSNESKCLTPADLCNNVTDCSQGEDEHDLICGHFCEWPSLNICSKKYPNLCPETEFYCDGKCVSIVHRCDGTPYCYDGADEPFDCLQVICPDGYFKCDSSGKCIPFEKVCDGYDDCPKLNKNRTMSDDETAQACNLVLTHLANSTVTVTSTSRVPITCESADLFRCKTSHFCINRTYVCDGDLDCSDSSDEENCDDRPSLFPLSMLKDYTCINGYRCAQQRHEQSDYMPLCIPLNELCDGLSQCPLGDDEHKWRCQNCTNCDSRTSFCEMINRIPICQCKKGYVRVRNGSCVLEENLCNWAYGLCPHAESVMKINKTNDGCNKKKTTINVSDCQCDRGYQPKQTINNGQQGLSCIVQSNRTFNYRLNPRAAFYIDQHGKNFTPIHPSHHVIDAAFVPAKNGWYLLYTEQRDGRGHIWRQTLDEDFHEINRGQINATQIWSSSLFHFTSLEVDWMHRFVYVLFDDPASSSNGIQILYSTDEDYTHLIFVNHLTFSNTKTISSINVHPLQGYFYISAYYDAQHSLIYRSLLDGSNLETFISLPYPVLGMTIDYRHPRLYVMLSNGDIQSYATDNSQPWMTRVYNFQNIRPYSIDLHDDTLVMMIYNNTDATYDEMWIDKFGRTVSDQYRKFQAPMIVRYVHQYKYPTVQTSNMVKSVCSSSSCPKDRICITAPSARPLCIVPGESNQCSSSCHSRGICSNGQCQCSNRTYTGDDCEMCRLSNQINVGCVHIGVDSPPPCMCYLSRSSTRQTPYLCTALKNDRGEIEVPCDRVISPISEEKCSRTLFLEPPCDESNHVLIYHRTSQTCLCREISEKKTNCYNNGLLIIDHDLDENSTACACQLPFTGRQCEVNLCRNRCQNNGTCTIHDQDLLCLCPNGFYGNECEHHRCQLIECQNNGQCQVELNKTICHCPAAFTGPLCQYSRHYSWRSWFLFMFICSILMSIIYTLIRHHTKILRLKHLFAHHRLHEQIGLEINASSAAYSHLPTSERPPHQTNSHSNRLLDDGLGDEIEPTIGELPMTVVNQRNEDFADDPFFVDEKQPIFSADRSTGRMSNTGIL